MNATLTDLGMIALFGAGVMFLLVAATTIVRKPAGGRRNRKFKQL